MKNLTILVTRPKPQGEILCEKIRAAGGKTIYFPTIEISPPEDIARFTQQMSALAQYDWLIFISPQAVYASAAAIHSIPSHVRIAAIGAGTAQALQEMNLPVAIYPKEDWSSEGLLDLAEFKAIAHKKIALIQGAGGREWLADTLTARGALVTSVIAYRRTLPVVDVSNYVNLLMTGKIDIITCTSGETLQNLKILIGHDGWRYLRTVPLLVTSERVAKLANELDFKKIALAKNASHHAIIETLTKGYNMSEEVKTSLWRNIGILISTSAVIAFLCLAYFAYAKLTAAMIALQNNLSVLQKNTDTAQQTTQQLNDALKNHAQAISELRSTKNNKDPWVIEDAQYLTKLANINLQFNNNIPIAITLLQTANQELSDSVDIKVLAIRKTLTADILALQSVPQVDITGIYLRLSALNEQLDKLPLVTKEPISTPQPITPPTDNTLPWWKHGLQQTWQTLSQIVVVRYNPKGVAPFITPEDQGFLYQNLHALLEKSMWALLHGQAEIYRASLLQTTQWIKQYFLQDSPVTQAVLNNLDQLQQINIHPATPKITNSLQAFQEYFKQEP